MGLVVVIEGIGLPMDHPKQGISLTLRIWSRGIPGENPVLYRDIFQRWPMRQGAGSHVR